MSVMQYVAARRSIWIDLRIYVQYPAPSPAPAVPPSYPSRSTVRFAFWRASSSCRPGAGRVVRSSLALPPRRLMFCGACRCGVAHTVQPRFVRLVPARLAARSSHLYGNRPIRPCRLILLWLALALISVPSTPKRLPDSNPRLSAISIAALNNSVTVSCSISWSRFLLNTEWFDTPSSMDRPANQRSSRLQVISSTSCRSLQMLLIGCGSLVRGYRDRRSSGGC